VWRIGGQDALHPPGRPRKGVSAVRARGGGAGEGLDDDAG